jgi:hypothetical protein
MVFNGLRIMNGGGEKSEKIEVPISKL